MRPYWKGHLRLSLVTIAVELYTATASASRLELHQIDKKTGKRIRYLKVVPGKGEVANKDIVKGFEFDSGKNVILTPEELDRSRVVPRRRPTYIFFSTTDPRPIRCPTIRNPTMRHQHCLQRRRC